MFPKSAKQQIRYNDVRTYNLSRNMRERNVSAGVATQHAKKEKALLS